MKPLPIRWKFALCAVVVVSVVLAVFAGGTFLHLYREQLEAVDLELEAEARHLAGLKDPQVAEKSIDELLRFQPWMAIAVFDHRGGLVRCSETLPESIARAALAETEIRTAHVRRGESWRLKVIQHGTSTYVLAHTLSEMHETIGDLLVGYALSLPIVVIVAAVGGWWVARRALAPLRELTDAAESIRADHLDRRVPAFATNDEIRRLGDVLNAMLARLEKSFQQSQRFAADASHELRTPLTIMHGEIERLLRAPNVDRTHEETLLSLQEEIGRLDRITEQLLLLARFDSGDVTMDRVAVDFSALVATACEDAEMLADANGIELTTAIAPGLVVTGDDAHLRRAVLSLLDNATRHNHRGGRVECALESGGGMIAFRVRNTGPGIPSQARAQLFQRFFRVDPARRRGGHGLGLNLSREIARAHGGEVDINPDAPAGWTEFVLTLPRTVQNLPATARASRESTRT